MNRHHGIFFLVIAILIGTALWLDHLRVANERAPSIPLRPSGEVGK